MTEITTPVRRNIPRVLLPLRFLWRLLKIEIERFFEKLILANYLRKHHVVKQRTDSLLITAAGGGSVGDEAMYEAFVQHAEAPIVIIHHRGENDLVTPAEDFGAKGVVLQGLVYGKSLRRHLEAFNAFLHLVSHAHTVSIIGADMMDGIYNDQAAARRFRLVSVASSLGADSKIIGFSWADKPTILAKRTMRQLPKKVRLLVRDPISAQRLIYDGAQNVETVADLAFLTSTAISITFPGLQQWLSDQKINGRDIALINANPRITSKYPHQEIAYMKLISALLEAGYSCLALPNDARHGSQGEVHYMQKLFKTFDDLDQIFICTDVLSPSEVVSVAKHCTITVSGRMHVLILAAVGGSPGVGLEYQGKFEGLYQLLGFDLRVPIENIETELTNKVFSALKQQLVLKQTLLQQLPVARTLAFQNLKILKK